MSERGFLELGVPATAAEALDLGLRMADLSEIDPDTGCRNWLGSISNGYGRVGFRGCVWMAHRLVYLVAVGPAPDLEIDHLCNNTFCVNLPHLEAVPGPVNKKRVKARKTKCTHGHEFTPENTAIDPRGHRRCRTCNRRQCRLKQIRRKRESTTSRPASMEDAS